MKLALVRRGYSATGGAEAYLKRFAHALVAAGHECTLFSSQAWPAAEWPFAIHRLPDGGSPRGFAKAFEASAAAAGSHFVFSLERLYRCDAFRAGDGVHSAWLERRARFEPFWKPLFRRFQSKHRELIKLERSMFGERQAGIVIANSKMVRDEITARFGYPSDQIHVVYNGSPPPPDPAVQALLRAEVRQELGFHERDYVILFAGSGWDRKGLRFAIAAMNEAALARPALLVVGKGRPEKMPRSTRVRYLGPVPELTRLLAGADAFLLPTIYDPFSNACLEALTAGLPVITTPANGFSEILALGEGEIVADPSDPIALARALEAWAPLDRRRAVREQLLQKGAQFTIERNLRETLDVIVRSRTAAKQAV